MLMLKGNSTQGELLKRGRLNTTYLLLKASTGMREEKYASDNGIARECSHIVIAMLLEENNIIKDT